MTGCVVSAICSNAKCNSSIVCLSSGWQIRVKSVHCDDLNFQIRQSNEGVQISDISLPFPSQTKCLCMMIWLDACNICGFWTYIHGFWPGNHALLEC